MNIIKISRPRFWLYLAGPFLIGTGTMIDGVTLYMLFYFLLPANLFLYGVNDIYDIDTDAVNTKKSSKESRVSSEAEKQQLTTYVSAAVLLGLPLLLFGNATMRLLLIGFFLLSYFYSAPPLRFKSRPYFDSFSNVLYIFPGLIAYAYWYDTLPSASIIIAAAAWTWAMHLFSAIPDITPDTKAGIQTTATNLGKQKSLLLCAAYWLIVAFFIREHLYLMGLAFMYVLIPTILYLRQASIKKIEKVYWMFPYLNGILGFSTYLYVIFST